MAQMMWKDMTILYVEDEKDTQEELADYLELRVGKLLVASDGAEGLALFQRENPDLIITDVTMPVMDGLSMIKAIRTINPKIQIVLCTALGDRHQLGEAINLSVDAYISKPINLARFNKVISKEVENLRNQLLIKTQSRLLEDYRKIVDASALVTKTDPGGRITYANDGFCNVSGYSYDELIGKCHNIVRHPDMSATIFEHMWKTIQSGEMWRGIIKDRSKSGGSIYLDTTILGIKDELGTIVEYIAIRYDVTELEEYRQELDKKHLSQILNLNHEIEATQREVVLTMGAIGESRSKETGNHVRRVAEYSRLLAVHYGLNSDEAESLKQASPMHDIGKVGIPDVILNKPGKLTLDEFEIMKTHSVLGYEMLKHSDRPILKAAATVAIEHHEKWDGSGYPHGKSGEDIHIYGRITAIADVFDALGSDRVYKKAWELERILDFIREESGRHFDPSLVELFFDHLDEFLAIRDLYRDEITEE